MVVVVLLGTGEPAVVLVVVVALCGLSLLGAVNSNLNPAGKRGKGPEADATGCSWSPISVALASALA